MLAFCFTEKVGTTRKEHSQSPIPILSDLLAFVHTYSDFPSSTLLEATAYTLCAKSHLTSSFPSKDHFSGNSLLFISLSLMRHQFSPFLWMSFRYCYSTCYFKNHIILHTLPAAIPFFSFFIAKSTRSIHTPVLYLFIYVFPFLFEPILFRFLFVICCQITFDRITKDFHDDKSNG